MKEKGEGGGKWREKMIERLCRCPLFDGMSPEDIGDFLRQSQAKTITYPKDAFIFLQEDRPESLHILLSGSVAVCSDAGGGKRGIVAIFGQPGEMFGEVFLFLKRQSYDHYAQALLSSKILEVPRSALFPTESTHSLYTSRILSNMLSIFAQKTYYMNQRLNILSSGSLRQKIAKLFLKNLREDRVILSGNREELADFLNTARPSLSRELMRMQEEGLIRIDKKTIYIPDRKKIEEILEN